MTPFQKHQKTCPAALVGQVCEICSMLRTKPAACEVCQSPVAVKPCDHCGRVECGDCRDACATTKFIESYGPGEVRGILQDRLGPAGLASLDLP